MLNPEKHALIVIDVQNFVLNSENHAPRPEFYQRLETVSLKAIEQSITLARKAGVEVIYTVMENLTKDGRDRSLDYKLSGFNIKKGSVEAQIPEPFAPINDEIVISKTSACLFNSTNITYLLRNMGVDQVSVVGFLTDQCVEQTIKAGASLGFHMFCIEDGVAANTIARHTSAIERFRSFCQIKQCAADLFDC